MGKYLTYLEFLNNYHKSNHCECLSVIVHNHINVVSAMVLVEMRQSTFRNDAVLSHDTCDRPDLRHRTSERGKYTIFAAENIVADARKE